MKTGVSEQSLSSRIPVQAEIEAAMAEFHQEKRWESIGLFSSDGLLMAKYGMSSVYGEDNLLEFAFSLIDLVKLLGDDLPTKEIAVRGKNRKTLVFRYFEAWDEEFILAAILSGRKGYRRAVDKLIKLIKAID
jgi:hypothetical protein